MVDRVDLAAVERELSLQGYAVREGNLLGVELASILQRRWMAAPQKGGERISTLRPMEQHQAPSRTLSAVHGLGQQPLHTDGAHLRRSPDVVVLHAKDPNATATAIWRLDQEFPSALQSGVFTVRGDGGSFLSHAWSGQRLRFDPVCMSPADRLAKEARAFLEAQRDAAHIHLWTSPNTLLFIDNKRSLHGREAVLAESDAESRVLERATYFLGAQ